MSDRTIYLRNKWIDHIANDIPYDAPNEMYVALATFITSSVSGTFDEVVGPTYTRVTASISAPINGQASSSHNWNFPQATTEWGTVAHFVMMDSGTLGTGNALYIMPLGTGTPSPFTVTDGDLFTVPSHSFVNQQQAELKPALGFNLPVGLAEDTRYFVVSASGDNLRLSLMEGGVPVDVGSGVGQIRRVATRLILPEDIAEFRSGSVNLFTG